MSALTNNTNLLPLAGFKIVLESHLFANTEFFAVTAGIPAVSNTESNAPFKNESGFVPGEHMDFDSFNIRMAVDENMESYEEIFNWMKSHTDQTDLKTSDISLVVMTSHNNPNKVIRFKNAFPVSLGTIEFNAQASEVEYAYVDVTFKYDYFDIEGDGVCG